MIAWFLSLLQGQQQDADDDQPSYVLQYFLAGHSTQKVAALTHPGVGGPALIEAQGAVEDEIREYISDLLAAIVVLRSELREAEHAQ